MPVCAMSSNVMEKQLCACEWTDHSDFTGGVFAAQCFSDNRKTVTQKSELSANVSFHLLELSIGLP